MKPEILTADKLTELIKVELDNGVSSLTLESVARTLFPDRVFTAIPGTNSLEVVPKYTLPVNAEVTRIEMIEEIAKVWTDNAPMYDLTDYYERDQVDYLESLSDSMLEEIYVNEVVGVDFYADIDGEDQ